MANTKVRIYIGLTTLVMGLVAAPSALAAGSAVDTYGGVGGGTLAGVSSGANGASAASDPGSLPFTGLDVGLLMRGAVYCW